MNRFTLPNTTQVPNLLFDDLLSELSGAELKVILYLVRRTFGFQREADSVSLSQFCTGIVTRDGRRLDSGTGLARPSVFKALESLEKRGLILVDRTTEENGARRSMSTG
jgi:DNA-binding MarR family transcriptional regulator